jgi:hypothetical protein
MMGSGVFPLTRRLLPPLLGALIRWFHDWAPYEYQYATGIFTIIDLRLLDTHYDFCVLL